MFPVELQVGFAVTSAGGVCVAVDARMIGCDVLWEAVLIPCSTSIIAGKTADRLAVVRLPASLFPVISDVGDFSGPLVGSAARAVL